MPHYLQKSHYSIGISVFLPLLGGLVVAGFAAVMMKALSIVWICLIFVGFIVFIPTFVVKDIKLYWLAIFIFILPLNITKMIGDSTAVVKITDNLGMPWGSLPALIITLSDLSFLLLLVIWFLEILTKKKTIYFPKYSYLALAFVGWSSLSLLRAPYPSFSFFELIRQIKFLIIYVYIINNIDSKRAIKMVVVFLLIGAFIQGVMTVGTYQLQSTSHVFGDVFGDARVSSRSEGLFDVVSEAGPQVRRGTSSVGVGGDTAKYFEFMLPLALVLTLTVSGFKNKMFYSTIFIVGLFAMYYTFSRGGLIGLAVSALICLFLTHRRSLIKRKWFLIISFLGLFCALTLTPKLYDYFTSRPESFSKRFDLFKSGIAMVADHPIFGVGLNNNTAVISKYTPGGVPSRDILPIHNHYLIIAAETGIPALLFFIWFFLAIVMKAIHCSKSRDIYIASLAIGIISAYMAISIHMLVAMIGSDVLQTLLWLFAGLIVVFSRIERGQIQ